jgi:endonuclease/exonuclease/phosphatase family metal-dependent hydrolase
MSADRIPHAPVDLDRAPAVTWFLFGPVLLLVGVVATAWPKPPEGPTTWWEAATSVGLLALALVSGTLLQALRPAFVPIFDLITGALLVISSVLAMLPASSGSAGPTQAALVIMWLGTQLAGTTRPEYPGARRPGLWLLCGALVFLAGVFTYYAAYDLNLGFPNGLIIIIVAGLVAGLNTVTMIVRRPGPPGESARLSWRTLTAVMVLAPVLVVATTPPIPQTRVSRSDTFRLITYNIRMGFGLDGRLSLTDIAAWAAAQKPDVVLLSEVDRGWLLNGGHDDLATIARGLGMRYYFARAADNVWGDALLTNLPVEEVHSHALGRHGYPTGAQAQAIVLKVGGRQVGIVNTHLQATEGQAPEVAAIVAGLAAGKGASAAGWQRSAPGQTKRPVILAGDLNLRPGDPAMRVLTAAGLTDPLIALGDPPTSPADAPVERIDHVLIGKGLTALSAQAPRLPYSDHLPVLTTLRLTSVDQEG